MWTEEKLSITPVRQNSTVFCWGDAHSEAPRSPSLFRTLPSPPHTSSSHVAVPMPTAVLSPVAWTEGQISSSGSTVH